MRYGVIADVHANLFALRAAVRSLAAAGVDRYLCAGDLVGFGSHPNECVEAVAELDPVCVAGNHDLIVTGLLHEVRSSERARRTQEWTRDVLRDDARAWLARLPRRVALDGIVMAHGSLDDPQEYVRTEQQADDQLRQLQVDHPEASALILGHTHRAWLFSRGGRTIATRPGQLVAPGDRPFLANPGSVGQSRQRELSPRARFALLDTDRDTAQFFAIRYDVRGARAALRAAGLPRSAIHLPRHTLAGARRRARRLLQRQR